MIKYWFYFIAFAMIFALGFGTAYNLYNAKPIVEVDQKAKIFSDSSVLIQRVHDTVLVDKMSKVDGTSVLHKAKIKIISDSFKELSSDTVIRNDTVWITKKLGSDTISVTLFILKDKENGIRVQAKTENGIIVGSIDVPMENYVIPKEYTNILKANISYEIKDSVSISLEYDKIFGPFIIGGIIGTHINNPTNLMFGITSGIKF